MFDICQQFLIQFINVLPFLIPFVLIINLCSDMLFGGGR